MFEISSLVKFTAQHNDPATGESLMPGALGIVQAVTATRDGVDLDPVEVTLQCYLGDNLIVPANLLEATEASPEVLATSLNALKLARAFHAEAEASLGNDPEWKAIQELQQQVKDRKTAFESTPTYTRFSGAKAAVDRFKAVFARAVAIYKAKNPDVASRSIEGVHAIKVTDSYKVVAGQEAAALQAAIALTQGGLVGIVEVNMSKVQALIEAGVLNPDQLPWLEKSTSYSVSVSSK